MEKIEVAVSLTAVVVNCNEESQLPACLESIRFCDETVVVDLGSTDASRGIARQYGAKVHTVEKVKIVERIRNRAVQFAAHDYVLFIDPDERVPRGMENVLVQSVASRPQAGLFRVPRKYYFRGKPLSVSAWGLSNMSKTLVVHRKRVQAVPTVHGGWKIFEGYDEVDIDTDMALIHHWASSFRQLFEKHRRYLLFEGEAHASRGARFGWKTLLRESIKTLREEIVLYRGFSGGPVAWFLTLFHVWYVAGGWLSLRRFERSQSGT